MSTFWTVWISVISLASIFGCYWLLWATRKSQPYQDETEETLGHSFDGIEEFDNPLPKWWLYMFIASIIFALIYLVLYPGLGSYKGLLGWTQENQWQAEVDTAKEKYGPLYAELAATPLEELAQDPKAIKMGQRLFANNCAVCHGSTARGSTGFPNLTDNDWLYGGTPEKIKETLTNGRNAAMPAWEAVIGDQGITEVANYVRALSGQETVDKTLAAKGAALFATNCAACHGTDGKGMQILGAPNLTDSIWLYGGTQQMVETTLRNGRNGAMPAFLDLLGEERVHLLAAYVYSLSHNN
jgi:cytochrome c oxidase cbb3-type subunit 3